MNKAHESIIKYGPQHRVALRSGEFNFREMGKRNHLLCAFCVTLGGTRTLRGPANKQRNFLQDDEGLVADNVII